MATASICTESELAVRVEGNSCDIQVGIEICAVLHVEETQYIDQSAYDRTPGICDFELTDSITFRNGNSPLTGL